MELLHKKLLSGPVRRESCRNEHGVEYVRLENQILVYCRHPDFEEVDEVTQVTIGLPVSSIREMFEQLALSDLNDLKDVTPDHLLRSWANGFAEIHTCLNEEWAGLIFRYFMGKLKARADMPGAAWRETGEISPDPYHLLAFTQSYY